MRLPAAPAPVLSPTGHHAAIVEDARAALVDLSSGRRVDLDLPATGSGAAFAPDDRRVALGAAREVALVAVDNPTWPAAGNAHLPGSLFRMALGNETLVAVVRTGTRNMSLCAWRTEGEALTPLGDPAGLDMGALAVYHLHVDEARERILVGGITGAQALSGDGKPFTGIFGLAPDYPLLWKGEGLPFEPHGYLFPLHNGGLAVTQRDRWARLTLDALPAVQVVDDHAFETPLERVALSPDGHMLEWMWAGDGDDMLLRVADVLSETPIVDVAFTLDGNFPALAVDDDGTATVVAGARPDQMLIVTAAPGRDVKQRSVTVPVEPDM